MDASPLIWPPAGGDVREELTVRSVPVGRTLCGLLALGSVVGSALSIAEMCTVGMIWVSSASLTASTAFIVYALLAPDTAAVFPPTYALAHRSGCGAVASTVYLLYHAVLIGISSFLVIVSLVSCFVSLQDFLTFTCERESSNARPWGR